MVDKEKKSNYCIYMKPARLVGFVSGVLGILCVAFLYTQRSYLHFIVPEPVFAANSAKFFGTTFYDVANTAFYLDPAGATSLLVNGNVGIGTTGPTAKLNVITTSGDGNPQLIIGDTGNSTTNFKIMRNNATGNLDFTSMQGAYGYTFMSGNVGIGTTNPADKVDIVAGASVGLKSISTSGYAIDAESTDSYGVYAVSTNSNGLFAGGNVAAYLSGNGIGALYATNNNVSGKTIESQQINASAFNIYASGSGKNYFQGYIGIGTTAPGNLLTVNQAANTTVATITTYGINLDVLGTDMFTIGGDASWAYLQSWNSKPLKINDQGNNVIFSGSGYVGIGETSPGAKLQVNDTSATGVAGYFFNLSTGSGADGLQIRIGNGSGGISGAAAAAESSTNSFIKFFSGNGTISGRIRGTGAAGAVAYATTTTGDFAELLKSDGKTEPGDVLTLSNGILVKATAGQDIAGVFSTAPTFVGGDKYTGDPTYVPLALSGVVPVNVTTKNGPIHAGDNLTVGTVPGVAVKATQTGQVVGKALEDYVATDTNAVGKIDLLINNVFYDFNYSLTEAGDLNIENSTGADQYAVRNTANNSLINRISAFAQLIVGSIRSGIIETKKLIVNGVDVAAKLAELTARIDKQEQTIRELQAELEQIKARQ